MLLRMEFNIHNIQIILSYKFRKSHDTWIYIKATISQIMPPFHVKNALYSMANLLSEKYIPQRMSYITQ